MWVGVYGDGGGVVFWWGSGLWKRSALRVQFRGSADIRLYLGELF